MMASAGLISMWISNTATALMMLPIGLPSFRKWSRNSGRKNFDFSKSILLGIAYACSIGGIGTLVGTRRI